MVIFFFFFNTYLQDLRDLMQMRQKKYYLAKTEIFLLRSCKIIIVNEILIVSIDRLEYYCFFILRHKKNNYYKNVFHEKLFFNSY